MKVDLRLHITFGGMCSWRRVAVARVFALVVRCRIMRLINCSRVGKNRDTRRGTPAGAGAGRTADHLAVLFSQKVLAVRKANCIYRPVRYRLFFNFVNSYLFANDKIFIFCCLIADLNYYFNKNTCLPFRTISANFCEFVFWYNIII